jgi:hypothetical protein
MGGANLNYTSTTKSDKLESRAGSYPKREVYVVVGSSPDGDGNRHSILRERTTFLFFGVVRLTIAERCKSGFPDWSHGCFD